MTQTIQPALAPCPTSWCTREDTLHTWQDCVDQWVVICPTCGVNGPAQPTEAEAIEEWNQRAPSPDGLRDAVLMLLYCPKCGLQHIDAPETALVWTGGSAPEPSHEETTWHNPPHRSHLCHGCGCIWRPADVATEGVASIATVGKADNWEPPANYLTYPDAPRFDTAPTQAGQSTDELVAALAEARDLLLERKQGSPARSAGHNARLVIEAALAKHKAQTAPAPARRYELSGDDYRYGPWVIKRCGDPDAWDWWGDGDGPDGPCGTTASVEACIAEIHAWEDEQPLPAEGDG